MRENNDFSVGKTILQILFSFLIGVVVWLLFLILGSVLLVTKDYDRTLIPLLNSLFCAISGFLAGIFVGYWHKNRGWLMGLAVGVLLAFLLITIAALTLTDEPAVTGLTWIRLLLLPFCSVIGGILGRQIRIRR